MRVFNDQRRELKETIPMALSNPVGLCAQQPCHPMQTIRCIATGGALRLTYGGGATHSTHTHDHITYIRNAHPALVTANNHGFTRGDAVVISGVTGTAQLNARVFTVGETSTNVFALTGIDGRVYSKYVSGGIAARGIAIAEISRADPGQVTTVVPHPFREGSKVLLAGVRGMWDVEMRVYYISGVTAHTFFLTGVNTLAFGPYTTADGTGYASQSVTAPVDAISDTPAHATVTFTEGHPFTDGMLVRMTGFDTVAGGTPSFLWEQVNGPLTLTEGAVFPIAGSTATTLRLVGSIRSGDHTNGGHATLVSTPSVPSTLAILQTVGVAGILGGVEEVQPVLQGSSWSKGSVSSADTAGPPRFDGYSTPGKWGVLYIPENVTRQIRVWTDTAHPYTNGDAVRLQGLRGVPKLDNAVYRVEHSMTFSFELKDNVKTVSAPPGAAVVVAVAMQGASASATETVITIADHPFENGNRIRISGVAGVTESTYIVARREKDTFHLWQLGGGTAVPTSGVSYSLPTHPAHMHGFVSLDVAAQISDIAREKDATVTTVAAHPFCHGNRVRITGVEGMAELNGREFTIIAHATDARKFRLAGVDSSGYTQYSANSGDAVLAASSTATAGLKAGAHDSGRLDSRSLEGPWVQHCNALSRLDVEADTVRSTPPIPHDATAAMLQHAIRALHNDTQDAVVDIKSRSRDTPQDRLCTGDGATAAVVSFPNHRRRRFVSPSVAALAASSDEGASMPLTVGAFRPTMLLEVVLSTEANRQGTAGGLHDSRGGGGRVFVERENPLASDSKQGHAPSLGVRPVAHVRLEDGSDEPKASIGFGEATYYCNENDLVVVLDVVRTGNLGGSVSLKFKTSQRNDTRDYYTTYHTHDDRLLPATMSTSSVAGDAWAVTRNEPPSDTPADASADALWRQSDPLWRRSAPSTTDFDFDFVGAEGELVFGDGVARQFIVVTLKDDNIYEGSEAFNVSLLRDI